MLIASTLASAALGAGLESARIIRDLARERGGRPDASLWFDAGPKLPMADAAQVNAVASDAAASDDSDLRNIVHAGTTLAATTLAVAERSGAGGEAVLAAIVLGYEAAGRIGEAITPGFRTRRLSRLPRRDLCRRGRRRAAARPRRGADGPGDRLVGDLDRRVWRQRRTRAWLANTTPGWQRCWAFTPRSRRSADTRPKSTSSKRSAGFSRSMAGSMAPLPARA